MKAITISIAAYNVAEYLSTCLDSFVDEECGLMDSIEVIVVNDGSHDNTAEIANRYVEKYPNTFKLIDKENGGYGSTINASLKAATGKYFKLVDGDDWVKTEDFYKLVAALKLTDADMVISNYCFVEDGSGKESVQKRNIGYDEKVHDFNELSGEDAFEMHYLAFKTEILRRNHIFITENCFYTDVEYMLKPIPYIESYIAFDLCVYMYRIGREGQSVSISSWQKNIKMAIKVTFILVDYYNKVHAQLNDYKNDYIFNRISGTAEGKYRIFLSFSPSRKMKKYVVKYDKKLFEMNENLYLACDKNRFVRFLRKSGFFLYYPMACMYRIHLKITKQI